MDDPDVRFARDMSGVMRGALDVAASAGDRIVDIPGKQGTPAREFDLAAHTHIIDSIAEFQRVGGLAGAVVLTEETPDLAAAVDALGAQVRANPDDDLLVLLWDPVDGSMQRLKSGLGWGVAGLASMWSGAEHRWNLTWAGVMIPGGREAVWLPGGKGWPAPGQAGRPTDSLAVNLFSMERSKKRRWLAPIGEFDWLDYLQVTGGNPLAVEVSYEGSTVIVQPGWSNPHDAIGTLILSQLGFEVYSLLEPDPTPVNPGSFAGEHFSDPTRASLKTVPPHVVGPPTYATKECWLHFRQACRADQEIRAFNEAASYAG